MPCPLFHYIALPEQFHLHTTAGTWTTELLHESSLFNPQLSIQVLAFVLPYLISAKGPQLACYAVSCAPATRIMLEIEDIEDKVRVADQPFLVLAH